MSPLLLLVRLVRMGLSAGLVCRNLGEYRPRVLPFPPELKSLLPRLVMCLWRDYVGRTRRGEVLDVAVRVRPSVLYAAHVSPFLHPC